MDRFQFQYLVFCEFWDCLNLYLIQQYVHPFHFDFQNAQTLAKYLLSPLRNFQIQIIIFIFIVTSYSCSKNYGVKETEGFIDGYIKPSKITTTAVSLLDPTSGLILHGLNFYETMNYTLNDLEKQYHIQALQYALNYSKNGEITKWFNNNRDSAGKVKILYSLPN